jgi:hypothetical protein
MSPNDPHKTFDGHAVGVKGYIYEKIGAEARHAALKFT